jgi:hypothetical protein
LSRSRKTNEKLSFICRREDGEKHWNACLAVGMDGFVTKPLDREKLAEVLSASTAARAA